MSKKPLVSVKGTPKLPPRREKVREEKKNWKEEGLELKLTHIEMVEGNWGEKASHSYHIKTNHPPRC